MKKYDEIFNDDSIEKKSWILYPNSNVAIKRCDKSFFEGNSTGLPKQEICSFFGIDYTFNKKFIIIKFRGKVYKAFLSIKNDLYNRSTLTWYQDLGDEFSKYKLENLAVCFRKLSNEEYLLDILSDIDDDYIVNDNVIVEGDYHIIESIRYERNAKNRKNAILIHGLYCQACGFNFESKYGILGKNYIEVHHLIPLSIGSKERIVNPETDLVCLCSNCHRMIHRIKNVDYNKALIELKRVIGENEFK